MIKQLYQNILFIILGGGSLLSSLPLSAEESLNLPTQWKVFLKQAISLPYEQIIPLEELNKYPTSLLLSKNQFPNFERYSWDDLSALKTIQQHCTVPTAWQINKMPLDSNLDKASQFELALCRHEPLFHAWFSHGKLLHPAGGTYADRYLKTLSNNEKTTFIKQYVMQLTLATPEHPLFTAFSLISVQGRDALLSQYRAYLMPNGILWLNTQFGIVSIAPETWHPLLKSLNISIEPKIKNTQSCSFEYSNLCIQPANNSNQWIIMSLAILFLGSVFTAIRQRRIEAQERKFILQFLTHELRTPITSLGLTVEQFRQQFDFLNNDTQKSFWRLLADQQRLSQLAETSKGFLSVDPNAQFQPQTAYLSDWLDHCLEKHHLTYQLAHDQELTLPYYWLGICLDNLIKNAQQHGKGNVHISVSVASQLRIEVRDEGEYPNVFQRFFKSNIQPKNHHNMGIGLTVVAQLMKKMGGKYYYYRHPTRCILELPL